MLLKVCTLFQQQICSHNNVTRHDINAFGGWCFWCVWCVSDKKGCLFCPCHRCDSRCDNLMCHVCSFRYHYFCVSYFFIYISERVSIAVESWSAGRTVTELCLKEVCKHQTHQKHHMSRIKHIKISVFRGILPRVSSERLMLPNGVQWSWCVYIKNTSYVCIYIYKFTCFSRWYGMGCYRDSGRATEKRWFRMYTSNTSKTSHASYMCFRVWSIWLNGNLPRAPRNRMKTRGNLRNTCVCWHLTCKYLVDISFLWSPISTRYGMYDLFVYMHIYISSYIYIFFSGIKRRRRKRRTRMRLARSKSTT